MSREDRLHQMLFAYRAARAAGVPMRVEDLCADDPELLSDLRRRLVEAEGQIPTSTGPPPTQAAVTVPNPPRGSSPWPDRLGGYTVVCLLGEGGMGAVLLAEDPALGRQVAIKVMHPRFAGDPSARDRFLREARSAAALTDDHVVPIFGVGEEAGFPYLVMPLLQGHVLEARLGGNPLTPDEVVRIGRETALGLAAAHARGLVHRDIKPANLWLEAPHGRVKILDFGLARTVDGTDALTQAGGVFGTPGYMAPEQTDGRDLDHRADLFSLGAVLYRCATGQKAFVGSTFTALLRAVAEQHPHPPHAVNPAVPRPLSALIMQLLEKAPSDRPPSAAAVAEQLARMAATLADSGDRAETVVCQPPRRRRRRTRAIVLGLTALVLAVGATVVALRQDPKVADPDTEPTGTNPPPNPPVEPAADPNRTLPRLRGSVDPLVRRIRDGVPVVLPLDDPNAMPLRTGDQFRIDAELSRPAFLYMFWIDETGAAVPMYPWTPGEWGTRPADEKPVPELRLTAPNGIGFEITGDTNGMETLLMLAFDEKLAATETKIRGWFADLKPLPFAGDRARVWFENFDVVRADQKRGFKYDGDVSRVDGPLGLQLTLKQRIGPVDLARAISFARVGKKGVSP